jgi:UDP-N-acetylglucosamine:LPS N-acetylglucosamine transferase
MAYRDKLLILMSKTGGGHVSLAEALRDRFEDEYEIKIMDPYTGFFHIHYRFVTRHTPWLYSAEFRLSNIPEMSVLAHEVFTHVVAKPLNMVLDEFEPDAVITTHPYLSYEVMRVLEKRTPTIPLVLLFSDPHVPFNWLSEKKAAATFATTRESYEQALSEGFDPARLHLVGWPVRRQFYDFHGLDREEMLTQLNLEPERFTIFMQGGGEGATRVARTVENVKNILAAGNNVQMILGAGTNQALLERFKDVKNVYPLPFTPEIAPYMAASDVIMGKAGPNVVFEAVTLGRPLIATSYIPGQEKANLEFIQRYGLGWVALKPEKQRKLIATLATGGKELSEMTEKIDAYRQWNAAMNKSMIFYIRSVIAQARMYSREKNLKVGWPGAS